MNNSLIHYVVLLCAFFPNLVVATNYSPWMGELLVFDWRNSLIYQTYPDIVTSDKKKPIKGSDIFVKTSLSTAALDYGIELEAMQAFTKKQTCNLDHLACTLKYAWWDDIAGDPFSIVSGITLVQAFRNSVHDVSSFHHGKAEAELYLSIGKESSCFEEWNKRWFSTIALGSADVGSPWMRINGEYDFKQSTHEWGIFYQSLFGLGSRVLNTDHFRGYGSIRHKSIEIGLKYAYLIDFVGKIQIQYINRVYAKNFPNHAQLFIIEFFYDFGIDALCF